jgi:hypothetical protein
MTIGSFSAFADESAKGLQGSRRVTIRGGAGTSELPSWYQALVTFTADGGLVATITDPLLQTGHGAWGKKGEKDFCRDDFVISLRSRRLISGDIESAGDTFSQ